MRVLTVAAILLVVGGGRIAFAQNEKVGDIEIAYPWAPATQLTNSSQPMNSAAYMNLIDHGMAPDELVSASSPVAQEVQLHVFDVENGVYGMHPVKAIEVAPGAAVTVLRPGGAHVMLEGLKQPLQAGGTFPLSLMFKRAGKIRIDVRIVNPQTDMAKSAWINSLQSPTVHGGLQ
jgi:periplasmic copper chaperone A